MKKGNREINIFSMSALDLFASALGAFILIAIVLFPFFPNIGNDPEDIAALRAELKTCQTDLAQTRAELQEAQQLLQAAQRQAQQAQEALEQCMQEQRKKFVLVLISWSTADDIDLHVTDPQGNEFYYLAKTHGGSRAKLEEDNTRGPGNEIWLHPKAEPGQYRVHYKFYDKKTSRSVKVRGAMLTPDGREEFPDHILRQEDEKPLVATITVDTDGIAILQTY